MSVLNVGRPVECVYRKGQGPGILANLDLTNTVFVSDGLAIDDSADTIPALGSIAVDGSRNVYASTLSQGTILKLQSTPGVTNWAPSPAQVAAQINALGLATAVNQQAQNSTAQATNTVLGSGIALPIGAAQEAGNLQTAKQLLAGTSTGALISGAGRTVGQEVAALIASGSPGGTAGGTPLLHGYQDLIGPVHVYNIAAGGVTNTGAVIPVSKPGYIIQLNGTCNAGSLQPFIGVTVRWFASDGVTQTGRSDWYIASTSNGSNGVLGLGPIRGASFQLTFTNLDTINAQSVSVSFIGTTQHIAREDWRSGFLNATPPSFSNPPLNLPTGNVLGGTHAAGISVTAGASSTAWLLPLYAGQALLSVSQSQLQNSLYQIFTPDAVIGTPGTADTIEVYNKVSAAASITSDPFTMPRCPCLFQITNEGSVTIQYGWSIVALEYAS